MQDTIKFVGLDVHAQQTRAVVLDPVTGELFTRRVKSPPVRVIDFLVQLGPGVKAVYEAGPTGFDLARAGRERGLDVRVCAPGLIPRKPTDRVKTDRRDAERLARLLAAGELTLVRVPSEEEEQIRDLVRAREDVREDLMRARHRLTKFLLRRGVRYEGQGSNWHQEHMRWLTRRVRFSDPASMATFDDYLAAVEALLERRSALERTLAEVAPASPFAETIRRLCCFRGISLVTATGVCAEVGDFGRFSHPAKLAGYLGLVPSEHTSGERRRQGAITKAGSVHARRLLIETAWHTRHRPRISEELKRRQSGQDPRVCQVAWRAQRRLYARWQKLTDQGRHPGVIAVACAREHTAFLWEAALLP